MITFISALARQRPSASFRRFAEVVNGPSDLFDALVQSCVVVFWFRLLSLEIIVTVLALTSTRRCRRFPIISKL